MNKYLKVFIENKWHWHSLTFIFSIILLRYTDKHPWFMDLGYSGNFLQGSICIGASAFASFVVEWVQGKFFGANRTWLEVLGSRKDMLVSIIAAVLGVFVYYLYLSLTK